MYLKMKPINQNVNQLRQFLWDQAIRQLGNLLGSQLSGNFYNQSHGRLKSELMYELKQQLKK